MGSKYQMPAFDYEVEIIVARGPQVKVQKKRHVLTINQGAFLMSHSHTAVALLC
jgi:hypothetical protein